VGDVDLTDHGALIALDDGLVVFLVGHPCDLAVLVVVVARRKAQRVGRDGGPVGQVVAVPGGEIGRVGGGVLARVDHQHGVADVVVVVGELVAQRIGHAGDPVELVVAVAGGEVVGVAGQRPVRLGLLGEVADRVVGVGPRPGWIGGVVLGQRHRGGLVGVVVDRGDHRAVGGGRLSDVVVGVVGRRRRGDEHRWVGGLVLGDLAVQRPAEHVVVEDRDLLLGVGDLGDVAAAMMSSVVVAATGLTRVDTGFVPCL
jgi:hypothetical protein